MQGFGGEDTRGYSFKQYKNLNEILGNKYCASIEQQQNQRKLFEELKYDSDINSVHEEGFNHILNIMRPTYKLKNSLCSVESKHFGIKP